MLVFATDFLAIVVKPWVRSANGSSNGSNGQNQCQVPQNQDRVPVVDLGNRSVPTGREAISREQHGYRLGGDQSTYRPHFHQELDERASFAESDTESEQGCQNVQNLQIKKDLQVRGNVCCDGWECFNKSAHTRQIGTGRPFP